MNSKSECEVKDKESDFVDNSSEPNNKLGGGEGEVLKASIIDLENGTNRANRNSQLGSHNCIECHDILEVVSEPKSQKLLRSRIVPSSSDLRCKKCKLQSQINKRESKLTNDKYQYMKCKFCKKEYSRRDSLRRHEKSHTNYEAYTCKICFVKFSGKNTLITHIRIHTGEKPFKCDLCEKSFNRPDTLKNHRRNHTNETPYECINCNKKFKFNSSRHSHKCIRESELRARPFKCMKCNKTYINKSSLKMHMRLHNENNSSETETYKCYICDKTFGYNFTLKQHLLRLHSTENSHKCKFLQCPKAFKEKYQLIIHHKRDHSILEPKVEKILKKVRIPARCKYCGKDFSRWISNLRRHERTHIKEKTLTYKCNLCFRKFKEYRIFRNHAKFHQEKNKKMNASNTDNILKNQPIVRVKKLSIKEIEQQTQNMNLTDQEVDNDSTQTSIKQEIEDDLNAIFTEIEEQNIKTEIDEALNEILIEIPQLNQKLHHKADSCNNNYKRKLRFNAKKNIKTEPLRMNNRKNVYESAFSVVFNWPKSKRNE